MKTKQLVKLLATLTIFFVLTAMIYIIREQNSYQVCQSVNGKPECIKIYR